MELQDSIASTGMADTEKAENSLVFVRAFFIWPKTTYMQPAVAAEQKQNTEIRRKKDR
jgi:hypothetical protein